MEHPKKSVTSPDGMTLTSAAFAHQEEIPRVNTAEGADLSPPLAWDRIPAQTKSLALIVDDPDAPDPKAPKRTWVHWVLYNIPPTTKGLAEGIAPKNLPPGTLEGIGDNNKTGWEGPYPPIGRHRYFFKLYALDQVLPDLGNPRKQNLEQAMQGHIIGKTELVGTYKKES